METIVAHDRAVERVIGAMRGRMDEELSLDELAKVAFMSPFHFNRTFRERTGIPPGQFLSSLRIEAAKRLLLTTDLSVTDVCLEVGYNSLGTFVRRFHQLVGASPRQLRLMARLGHDRPAAGAGAVGEPDILGACMVGSVDAPASFHGRVFVGLFEGPIPQGRPVACAALPAAGPYAIRLPPVQGRYRVFAVGIPDGADARGDYLSDTALRGGGECVTLARGCVLPEMSIVLRPPLATDPPIVLSLPAYGAEQEGLSRSSLGSAGPAARTPRRSTGG